jgi:Fe-S cluster biogenesis protein NfuA
MPVAEAGEEPRDDVRDDVREAGDRITTLLEASGPPGSTARERAEQLVRLVVDLYGAGLTRLLELADAGGQLDGPLLAALAGDDLVASLLLVHGLHPYGAADRVERGLAATRDDLDAHGAQVELLAVTADGVARLRITGGGEGCGSSPAALARAVEEATWAAAPDLTAVDVVAGAPGVTGVAGATGAGSAAAALIPVDALTARLRAGVAGAGVAGTGVAGTGVAGTGVAGTGVAGTGVGRR